MTDPIATIVIRTKNKADTLPEVLQGLRLQRNHSFEVLVVDSGSTDGTLQIAREFSARIIEIPAKDFSYGYALNVGAKAAETPYIVFLSGDAIPQNPNWLKALLTPLQDNPRCAGSYGRQVGDWELNPFEARALEQYYGEQPRKQQTSSKFSNANAAIRRKVWEQFPYNEEVLYAEDHLWARRVLEAGHTLAYTPEAVVQHVHHDSFSNIAARRKKEYIALQKQNQEPGEPPFSWLWAFKTALIKLKELMEDYRDSRIHLRHLPEGLTWYGGSWWGRVCAHRALQDRHPTQAT